MNSETDKNVPDTKDQKVKAAHYPVQIVSQYVRDLSFENPNAAEVLSSGKPMPKMDINIGMDARKITDKETENFYEVVLNVRAEAKSETASIFIAELQYGASVILGKEIPEDQHHPFLLIEIPRMIFPYARHILSSLTADGGYPPLMLAPVDFHDIYRQRFAKEIEKSQNT